jgi:TnpA family transposase
VADWDLIEARWKDLMQVALSVQAGAVLPSMLLRKLGTQSRQNQLYRAFRELGRVVRTIFLLEYISTAELRRSIHTATTKIEPRAPSPIGSASMATSSAPAMPRVRRSE